MKDNTGLFLNKTMKEDSLVLFELKEHENRLKKCQSLMEKQGLDVLILSQASNVTYMTGYRTQLFFTQFRPFVCIVPKKGLPALIIPSLEGKSAKAEAWFDEIHLWGVGCEAKNPIQLIKKYFSDKNLLNTVIGMELDMGQRPGMLQVEIETLYKELNQCKFKSCSELMWKLRSVKSKKEVEFMKESCRISEKAFEVFAAQAKAGMTEREAYKIMGQTMLAEGSELYGFLAIISGVDHYKLANPWPTDRKFKKGDMVICDYGAVYQGYWTDLTRSLFIDSVSDRQRELFEAAFKIQEAAVKVIKPKVPVGEIDKAGMQKIEDLGYSHLVRHRSGHSIGLEMHESPSISSDITTLIEPGMVFCIEPAVYDLSAGKFRIEDEILVTEKGFEWLSKHPKELIIK